MATSAASSEHFEKLHEIFRGLHEDLRRVPERLLGTGGTGEPAVGRALGNTAPNVLGGKALTLFPDMGLFLFSADTYPRPGWTQRSESLPAFT